MWHTSESIAIKEFQALRVRCEELSTTAIVFGLTTESTSIKYTTEMKAILVNEKKWLETKKKSFRYLE